MKPKARYYFRVQVAFDELLTYAKHLLIQSDEDAYVHLEVDKKEDKKSFIFKSGKTRIIVAYAKERILVNKDKPVKNGVGFKALDVLTDSQSAAQFAQAFANIKRELNTVAPINPDKQLTNNYVVLRTDGKFEASTLNYLSFDEALEDVVDYGGKMFKVTHEPVSEDVKEDDNE